MRGSRLARALWAASMAMAIGAAPRPARAQSGGDKAAAEALFDEGKKLFLEKKFAEACPRFEASERLDPGIGTLLFLADCYENVGRVASAWATFREASSVAKASGQADRERVATERARLLEPRLYRLAVKVEPTAGIKVMRNETELKPEAWNASLPVDPGAYTLTASAAGKKPWSMRLSIPASAGAQEVTVPALDDDPNAPKVVASPRPEEKATPAPPPPAPETPGRAQRVAGIVVGTVGLLGVAVGAGMAPLASSKFSSAKSTCPASPCSDKAGVDLAHEAVGLADGATAAFIVGGAALAAGIITFATAPRPAPPRTGRVWLAPMVGPSMAGLAAGGVFR